jgi:hypothetical protein
MVGKKVSRKAYFPEDVKFAPISTFPGLSGAGGR